MVAEWEQKKRKSLHKTGKSERNEAKQRGLA